MSQKSSDRRTFIAKTCAAFAIALAGSAVRAVGAGAQENHETTLGHGGSEGYIMDASVKKHCGTCEFWGGPRRISEDGKTITITGLGWCNNRASHNYQKLTSPEHGPMDTWRKWSVLG